MAVIRHFQTTVAMHPLEREGSCDTHETLTRLNKETYKRVKEALCDQFDPPSKHKVYKAEL